MRIIEESDIPTFGDEQEEEEAAAPSPPFDFSSMADMEISLTSLYEGLPGLRAELEILQSSANITACASDASCAARVTRAIALAKRNLESVGEELSTIPQLEEEVLAACLVVSLYLPTHAYQPMRTNPCLPTHAYQTMRTNLYYSAACVQSGMLTDSLHQQ